MRGSGRWPSSGSSRRVLRDRKTFKQTRATMVLVQYIFEQAFQKNNGGYSATIALALFVIVLAFSLLQFQILRIRGQR